jgi:hypothetical protein
MSFVAHSEHAERCWHGEVREWSRIVVPTQMTNSATEQSGAACRADDTSVLTTFVHVGIAIAEGLCPAGSRPAVSKTGRAQIVRAPATAYVNPGSRGAYFIAVGVEGIQETRFIGPNPRLHLY